MVILDPVPRILLQQGTNLVNKFALLLHKCRFAQDSRDKPENDGSWRCWLSICCKVLKHLFCVINGHFFSVIRGHRPANLDCRISSGNDNRLGRWLRAVCNLINTPHSALSCHSLQHGARDYGRSMIEMLGVLAIIGVLSVGGIAGYSKAMTKFKTNKVIDEVITIANNIKTLYANQKNYASLSDIDLKASGIIPAEMYDENGEIKNAFNGEVIITAAWYDGTHFDIDDMDGEMRAYSIAIRHIPEDACIELATQAWQNYFGAVGIQTQDNINNLLTNMELSLTDCLHGSAFGKGSAYACAKDNQIPISPDKAALACDCSASDNLCDFFFTGK